MKRIILFLILFAPSQVFGTVYCLQAIIEFGRSDRRDDILTAVQSRIESKTKWDVVKVEPVISKAGNQALHIEVRFTAETDMTDLKDYIIAQAVDTRAPLAGSWMRVHECVNDHERERMCPEGTLTEW